MKLLSIKDILVFTKSRISISVAISAVLGYLLSIESVDFHIIYVFIATYLLASGSSALNQVQEWKYDEIMERTSKRPLPMKKITPKKGLMISISFLYKGLAVLYFTSPTILSLLLGIAAIVVYNLIYTPMKRKSSFAAIPGALIGAIPPAIGWTYGNINLLEPKLIALMLFFFIWQIPHFWLLLIIYKDQYKKAGFPVLTDLLTTEQISRISYVWIYALVLVGIFIPILENSINFVSVSILILLSIFLVYRTRKLLKVVDNPNYYKFAFIQVNIFVLSTTLVLSLNKLLNF
ncbi:MAG: protoheme IX farnesyltransferase [Candidatus Kapaibacteriota bacterium]